ncbi:MAG: hypothetical protein ACOZHQ_16085 [Thermodesulfobacteriota bacterium]
MLAARGPSPERIRAGRGRVLVVGGGRFGSLAAERLGRRVLAVVEPAPSAALRASGAVIWEMDGLAGLHKALTLPRPPAWVAPCLPRHLFADWLRTELAGQHPRNLSLEPGQMPVLPSVMAGREGQLYLSLTDTICPDDCAEPGRRCPKTGLARERNLYDILAGLDLPGLIPAVLVSRQLAPGVGGVRVAQMLAWRAALARSGGAWLVATACCCHGVAEALELRPAAGGGSAA